MITSGTNNIAIGQCAGCSITTGNDNTVIGTLQSAAGCVCTLLIGAGACERIRVDNSGLYINNALWCNTGFIGSRLVSSLVSRGYTVSALSRKPKENTTNLKFVQADLFKVEELEKKQ